jgi:hypothetical protein
MKATMAVVRKGGDTALLAARAACTGAANYRRAETRETSHLEPVSLGKRSPTWDGNIPSSRVLGRPANILSLNRFLKRLTFIAERLNQDYLLGAGFSVADA